MRNTIVFVLKSVVAGLALAFIVVWVSPDRLLQRSSPATRLAEALDLIPRAVDRTAPAVVNIYSTRAAGDAAARSRQRLGLGRGQTSRQLVTSLGSGVIIDAGGDVVTNHHVVAEAADIRVQLADGRVAVASVIGTDADTDLALLRVELPALPAMTLGRSDTLRIGELVLAIGNPYGLSQTVTQGIVSATAGAQRERTRVDHGGRRNATNNAGNSGGALVNLSGELIGINTAVLGSAERTEGIGFAIPVNLVRGVVHQLREHGRVRRGWLGIVPRDLTGARAAQLGLDALGGIEIVHVYDGSPAAGAGLRAGDVLTHINEQRIQVSRQALNIVAASMPGDDIRLRGLRGGADFDVSATVREQPRG